MTPEFEESYFKIFDKDWDELYTLWHKDDRRDYLLKAKEMMGKDYKRLAREAMFA